MPPQNCVVLPGEGAAVLHRSLPALVTLVAADIAGGCEWLLQTTAEYAKVRVQFDRPIGFFQAVKHPIVNMMIAVDETRSLVYNAACAYDTDPGRCSPLCIHGQIQCLRYGGILSPTGERNCMGV